MEVHIDQLTEGQESRSRLLSFLTDIEAEFSPPLSEFLMLEEYVHKVLEQGEVAVVADCKTSEIVGAVIYYCSPSEYRYGWISVVATKRRRTGIGRKLLSHAVERCNSAGMAGVEIQTWESNVASRALFEAVGFSFVGLRDNRQGGAEQSAFYRNDFGRASGV